MTTPEAEPLSVVHRLLRATNAHDIDALVGCFADEYSVEVPAHPARSFRGIEQVRRTWTQIFAAVPDIATQILRSAVDGDTVWTEWEMSGTRVDGAAHRMRGVFIFGTGAGQAQWGRMFLEPVEDSGGDMNAAVRAQLQTTQTAPGSSS